MQVRNCQHDLGQVRRAVRMKPLGKLQVNEGERVSMHHVFGNPTKDPARTDQDQCAQGELQAQIALGRKPGLQKRDLRRKASRPVPAASYGARLVH